MQEIIKKLLKAGYTEIYSKEVKRKFCNKEKFATVTNTNVCLYSTVNGTIVTQFNIKPGFFSKIIEIYHIKL